jgi:hypothetical protein
VMPGIDRGNYLAKGHKSLERGGPEMNGNFGKAGMGRKERGGYKEDTRRLLLLIPSNISVWIRLYQQISVILYSWTVRVVYYPFVFIWALLSL